MATLITATLDHQTLQQLFDELTPLTVNLGKGGSPARRVTVNRPSLIEFIPGRGLRITLSGELHWTVAGVPIPLTIERTTLIIEPGIAPPPEPGRQIFKLKIEELDVKLVPGVVEDSLLPLINAELVHLEEPLGWNFAKTLSARIKLPPEMVPVESFTVGALTAVLQVTSDAIILKVPLELHFEHVGVKLKEVAIEVPAAPPPATTTSS